MNPLQSGNFDFPQSSPSSSSNSPPNHPPRFSAPTPTNPTPASTSVPFPPIPSLPTHQRQLQDLFRLEREDREETPPTDPPSVLSNVSADHRRHQGIRNTAAPHAPTGWPLRLGATTRRSNPPTAASEHRLRHRATPSERYLQLYRPPPALRQRSSAEHLAQSRFALETIRPRDSNITLNHPLNEDITTLEYEGEAEVNRRNKRRKLDVDSCGAGLSGFSYGRYGQVEPGELNMQIVSCDGGNYAEDDGGSRDYWAENVLRKDSSVYCTKSNRCNLVLRHKGGTAFTLTELDIKAPRRGFTAPVREGMIFISMTSGDLLSRTARYQIRYSPSSSHFPPSSPGRMNRPSRRSAAPPFRTPDAAQMETHRLISELNRRSDLSYLIPTTLSLRNGELAELPTWRMRAPLENAEDSENDRSILDAGENCDSPLHAIDDPEQNHGDIVAPNPLPFTVTAEYTDEENETSPDSTSEWDGRATRGVAGTHSDEDEDEPFGGRISAQRSTGRRWEERWRLFGRSPVDFQAQMDPSSIEATLQAEPFYYTLGEEEEMLAPHARFSIKKEKSKCSIKFDPPVSGRFILLKLWSQSRDENIDIQSIVAHGFAGPRYFPAVEMR